MELNSKEFTELCEALNVDLADLPAFPPKYGIDLIRTVTSIAIAKARQAERERIIGMIEEMIKEYVVACMNGKIKKMKPYDEGLSDLKSRLNN